jgi:hypothetical protein
MFEGVGQYANNSLSKWIRQHPSDIFWSTFEEDAKLYCYDILYSRGYLPPPEGLENSPLGRIIRYGKGQVSGSRSIICLVGLIVRF